MDLDRSFPSSDGINNVHYHIYAPEKPATGVIQFCHGMCEYIEQHEETARFFTGRGYIFAGHDCLGHGRTAATPDDLGFFGDHNGWRYLVRDCHGMTEILKAEYPDLPLILMGHSMGSFISRLMLSWFPEEIEGLVMLGTSDGFSAGGIPEKAAAMLTKIGGERFRSRLMTRTVMSVFNVTYENSKSDYDWTCSVRSVVERHAADPLNNFVFTAKGYDDMLTLLREVSTNGWEYSLPSELPMLIASGDKDPVGYYGKGVSKLRERLKNAGAKDVTLKLYEDNRHELLSDISKNQVLLDIWNWIEERFPGGNKNEEQIS